MLKKRVLVGESLGFSYFSSDFKKFSGVARVSKFFLIRRGIRPSRPPFSDSARKTLHKNGIKTPKEASFGDFAKTLPKRRIWASRPSDSDSARKTMQNDGIKSQIGARFGDFGNSDGNKILSWACRKLSEWSGCLCKCGRFTTKTGKEDFNRHKGLVDPRGRSPGIPNHRFDMERAEAKIPSKWTGPYARPRNTLADNRHPTRGRRRARRPTRKNSHEPRLTSNASEMQPHE